MLNPARQLPSEEEPPRWSRAGARFCLLPALAAGFVLAFVGIVAFRRLTVAVPDLAGARLGEAVELLHRCGLVPVPAAGSSALHPDLTVAATRPVSGTRLPRHATVEVEVTESPEDFRVPSLLGLSHRQALEVLSHTRFSLGAERAVYSELPPGVIAQNPRSGELSSGGLIDVLLSLGAEPATYIAPHLVGAPIEPVLVAYGFRIQRLAEIRYRAPGADEVAGQILEQDPPPGDPLGLEGLRLVVAADPNTPRWRIVEVTVPEGGADPQPISFLSDGSEAARGVALPSTRVRMPVPVGTRGASVQVRIAGAVVLEQRLVALAERSKSR
jgi:hypothetical protein